MGTSCIELIEGNCYDRRESLRVKERAEIRVALAGDCGFSLPPVIESTRTGARFVLAAHVKKDQKFRYSAKFGANNFVGEGRIAWTVPLNSGKAICGVEFLTFKEAAAA